MTKITASMVATAIEMLIKWSNSYADDTQKTGAIMRERFVVKNCGVNGDLEWTREDTEPPRWHLKSVKIER